MATRIRSVFKGELVVRHPYVTHSDACPATDWLGLYPAIPPVLIAILIAERTGIESIAHIVDPIDCAGCPGLIRLSGLEGRLLGLRRWLRYAIRHYRERGRLEGIGSDFGAIRKANERWDGDPATLIREL